MLLDVSKALAAPGTEIPFDGELQLSETLVLGETVRFREAARLSGTYTSIGEVVSLKGHIAFAAEARCARCLAQGERAFHVPFEAVFAMSENPEDPDQYVYDGAFIDPARMADDAALLALPMQWLCREDCRGLCPICGANHNHAQCTCRSVEKETSLSALRQLLNANEKAAQDESEV